jgi:ribokinase
LNVACVGHIEWVQFARLPRLPEPGEIAHAAETWQEAAGGGAMAAAELARLAGQSAFFTAVGEDDLAARAVAQLTAHRVRVHAARRPGPSARAFTTLTDDGERTIVVLGDKLRPAGADALPWEELARCEAVYFASGDEAALVHARQARVLVATARVLPVLQRAGVPIEALVLSEHDAGERYGDGQLDIPPKLVVWTHGARGGRYRTREGSEGTYAASALTGPKRDAYGAGDSFAAALTWALATGLSTGEALAIAARSGMQALLRSGAHGLAE